MILRVSRGIPEGGRVRALEGDERGDANRALVPQDLLAGAHQLQRDAGSAVVVAHGKPIQVPSPAIPAGDQRAGDLTAVLRDQERMWSLLDQAPEIAWPVRRGRVLAARPSPQLEYGGCVLEASGPDSHGFGAQEAMMPYATMTV